MLHIQFGAYPMRVARHSSPVYALLAAILLDGVLVFSLLQVTFRFRSADRSSQSPPTSQPAQRVTYMNLAPTDRVSAATNAIIKAPVAASPKSRLPPSAGLTFIESPTAPIDTVSASFESDQQRARRRFQALVPSAVEHTDAEIIDSIIKTSIQPGNDSAARMRLARRHAVDWTVRARGESYGMSPGEVHLGKISIRLPLVFAEPLSFDSDRRRLARLVNEDTRSSAARAIRHAAFDSSVASIRRRKGAERMSGTDSIPEPQRIHH
jgi:hypothetical protein